MGLRIQPLPEDHPYLSADRAHLFLRNLAQLFKQFFFQCDGDGSFGHKKPPSCNRMTALVGEAK